MSFFHVWKKLKSVFLVALSVAILTCSIPFTSIRSQALEALTYESAYALYLAISSYLLSRGYSAPSIKTSSGNISLNGLKSDDSELLNDTNNAILTSLNEFSPGLGDRLFNAFGRATFTGKLFVPSADSILMDEWLYNSTHDSRVLLGYGYEKIDAFSANTISNTNFNYLISGQSRYQTYSVNFTSSVDYIPIVNLESGTRSAVQIYIFPLVEGVYNYVSIDSYENSNDWNPRITNFAYGLYPNIQYIICYDGDGGYNPSNLTLSNGLYFNNLTRAQIENIATSILNNGYFTLNMDIDSTQIVDTSDLDILSSSSEIDANGDVQGGTTIYLPDTIDLEEILTQFQEGLISLYAALKALGLSSVASDATLQEKEDALSDGSNPPATYDWLTSTLWGANTITDTTSDITASQAEESSIADSIGDTLRDGNNSEDDNDKNRGKGLLAALLIGLGIWTTPIIAGDPEEESDSGGTGDDSGGHPGYLAETVAGMAIAGSLVDDFFDAAGGSDGFGFIYTVGASFVIFSVIIGAANYFGALFHGEDTKQASKPFAKNSSPNKTRKQSSYSNKNGVVT